MWFAGLFDGEGSVILSQRSLPGGGSVRIEITNTVRALLERAREVVGAGYITVKPSKNQRHQDKMIWTLYGGAALEVLRQVRPWLIVKAERADAVLAGETFARLERWDRIYPPTG